MNVAMKFHIAVFLVEGDLEDAQDATGRRESFATIAEVEEYTQFDAFHTMFDYLAGDKNNYGNPVITRAHEYLAAIRSGAFTVRIFCVGQEDWDRLRAQRDSGELVVDNELIRRREQEEERKSASTVIVGHLWDDDPNNGKQDFSNFDFVFLLKFPIGKQFTSIYDIPAQIELGMEELACDKDDIVRENAELTRYYLHDAYERWSFQFVTGEILDVQANAALRKSYGYVSAAQARQIVAACVAEKARRKKENQKTAAYKRFRKMRQEE